MKHKCYQALLQAREFVQLLTAQQQFYFLRGVLYQFCIVNELSILEYEDTFIPWIRSLANNEV